MQDKSSMNEAEKQMRAMFDRFKELHPNNSEPFTPTLPNMQRWNYHIRQAEKQAHYDSVSFETDAEAIEAAKARAFKSWDDFPAYMQSKYQQIAGMFPGVQFYACGSRVRGEYVEGWSGDDIRKLRKALHKSDKRESDYDVCMDIAGPESKVKAADIRSKLPIWADLVTGVPDEEKISIPMWDFSKIPEYERANVLALYKAHSWGKLMALHNQYKLSPHTYCCDEKPIIKWFKYGIENGLI